MPILTPITEYAELVKEQHALNKIIAPVETDLTGASQAYAKGAKFIYNGIMYQAKTAIAQGAALVLNTNYEAAPDVETQIANEAAARSQMGAKNLLPFDLDAIKELNTAGTWASNVYTYRGVDFTVNPDGTILADGQATGGNASIKVFAATSSYEMLGKNVILNGCPSGGSATTYRIQAYRMGSADGATGTYFDDGDGTIAFDALNNASGTVGSFAVAVYENYDADNLLFKPMVRLATDSNDSYQPYAKTNKELTDDVSSLNTAIANEVVTRAKLTAHNLLPITAVTQVKNEATFTINSDGSVTTAINGTLSADTELYLLKVTDGEVLDDVPLILSGCPSGGSASTYYLEVVNKVNNVTQILGKDTGNGFGFDADGYPIGVRIVLKAGQTGTKTFYPMIRLASDPSTDYAPYAKTNRELTEIKNFSIEETTYVKAFTFVKIGNTVDLRIPAVKDTMPLAQQLEIASLPPECIPAQYTMIQCVPPDKPNDIIRFTLSPDTGKISAYRYGGTVGTGTLMNIDGNLMYLTRT